MISMKEVSSSIIGGNGVVSKVDHIGIAVSNLEESIKFYVEVLGLELHGTETVEEQKVKVAFLPVGDTEVELLEATSPDSPIAKFIEAKGQGVQHIAFKVDNIEAALEEMRAKGVRLIDEKPRYGAGGAKIAFLHPKSTNGVLIELCEKK
jgi:methylmalonyl-CoA/ethylmalonyl-CoA epimerase